ncbi:hypothetical protein MU1_03970 [Paenibacillus glycanilyticus]|uniref:Uncharacterized protein n=2 Tax=Paenibacillus glycanilyticus TaxID=126569 RepID=A0ABQ6G725_9BACL|nr:hypothetical protein MU1_03970 [Paenibacillus glycanilyticus]
MIASPVKKSYKWSLLGIVVILFIGGTALTNANTREKVDAAAVTEQTTATEIEELTNVWANALKTREGKPRYDMMSAKAKEKFEQEQIIRAGEDWNFNIGVSSPWVIDYESKIDGLNVVITYVTKTSEPAYYKTVESVSFVKENGKFVVDDYEILTDGELIHTGTMISRTDYDRMMKIIISVNKGELPVTALKDAKLILQRKDGLNNLSRSVREEYLKENGMTVSATDQQGITEQEYLDMSYIIGEVNAGDLPIAALKDAEPLLQRNPEMITKETWAKYNALKSDYQTNEQGETYGHGPFTGVEPDLIKAEGENGVVGYVKASDLSPSYSSPEEALANQELLNKSEYRSIHLYKSDGKTIIGEFRMYSSK